MKSLYKLLLVDDEAFVRSGLRECIDWQQYGIEIIGEAEDGVEALNLIADTPVHIVITDVKMPHMDGIALSEHLRERYAGIKIVFISGYGDLDYVKSALKIEAVDYILKPLQLKELNEVMEKVTLQLRQEELLHQQHNELVIKLNQSIPLLRERYLVTLVSDQVKDTERIAEKFDYLGIRLDPFQGSYCVIKIHIDNLASLPYKTEKERQLASFALLNICEDIINASLRGNAFETRPGEYAVILNLMSDTEEETLFVLINECRKQLNQLLKLHVTIGVGNTVNAIASLPYSYHLASEAVKHKWFLGKNQIITIDSLSQSSDELKLPSMPDTQLFASLLKSQQMEEAIQYIQQWFASPTGKQRRSVESSKNGCIQLLLTCSNLLMELDIQNEEISRREHEFWDTLNHIETIENLSLFLCAHVELVHDAISDKRDRKIRNVVKEIQAFIETNYAREFTIAEIANSVYLTTTYICLIFKQETDMTINEYVTNFRITKAKEMLRDFRNKMYDICFAVGYKDPNYFRKLFKKHTGYSPTEYRDKML